MKAALVIAVVVSLLTSLLGCAADDAGHTSFWDQKPDPRAYRHSKSPYEGN